jgi:hypothetical protein
MAAQAAVTPTTGSSQRGLPLAAAGPIVTVVGIGVALGICAGAATERAASGAALPDRTACSSALTNCMHDSNRDPGSFASARINTGPRRAASSGRIVSSGGGGCIAI